MEIKKTTKIIATVGPSSQSKSVIEKMINAGVDIFRLNFSHGDHDFHQLSTDVIRAVSAKLNRKDVAILGDLQGPKIRINKFVTGSVNLKLGNEFTLDINHNADKGNEQIVGVEYKLLIDECNEGDIILLDDGLIHLEVKTKNKTQLITTVIQEGILKDKKGINVMGGGLNASSLTPKDFKDLDFALKNKFDFIAISFVKNAEEVKLVKQKIKEKNVKAEVVSKIERGDLVEDEPRLKEIIAESYAIMIARGDLGIEVGSISLISIQKKLIRLARINKCVVITATQMMESMIQNPVPTRAEVFDVANAILDGTDAVMLSAETAVGKYPVKVIKNMYEACIGAENYFKFSITKNKPEQVYTNWGNMNEMIAFSAVSIAINNYKIKYILCFSESGSTPKLISRLSTNVPIIAFYHKDYVAKKMSMIRNVISVHYDIEQLATQHSSEYIRYAINILKEKKLVNNCDIILCTFGTQMREEGGTNNLRVITV